MIIMRSTVKAWTLLFLGVCLIVIGFELSYAQDDEGQEDAEYIGARDCRSCHRGIGRLHTESAHALTLSDVRRDQEAIVADFEQGEEVRIISFPDESQPRPVTPDDIAFTLGAGRGVQMYLIERGRNDYLVLPFGWNVHNQEWQTLASASEWPGPEDEFGPSCAGCHTVGLNTRRYRWEEDGVQCEACHGPGSLHAELAEAEDDDTSPEQISEIRSLINRGTDAQVCGQCHSRGSEPEGLHPYPIDYLPGNDLLSGDVFRLVAEDDPEHWWITGHARQPNMQFNEWLDSTHATALDSLLENESADVRCLVCHSGLFQAVEQNIASLTEGESLNLPGEVVGSVAGLRFGASELTNLIAVVLRETLAYLIDTEVRELPEDFAELRRQLLSVLEIDAASVDQADAFVSSILPQLYAALAEVEATGGDAQHHRKLREWLFVLSFDEFAAGDFGSENSDEALTVAHGSGISCTTCHDPHIQEETPANLVTDPYTLCVACHQQSDLTNDIHHPVREIFEGRMIVPEVAGVPGGHFTAEDGPDCATCHMPEVPVNTKTRASHVWQPVLPGMAIDVEGLHDTCSLCHGELVDAQHLQQLIDDIQTNTQTRMDGIQSEVTDNTPSWVSVVVAAIDGDGSGGIHNSVYTNALLSAAELELGIPSPQSPQIDLVAAIDAILPDAVPTVVPDPAPTFQESGLTLPSLILLGIAAATLIGSAFAFFFKGSNDD